jgi:hypothetical protein
MLGRQTGDQSQLFYLFNLERRIPAGHLLRRINPAGAKLGYRQQSNRAQRLQRLHHLGGVIKVPVPGQTTPNNIKTMTRPSGTPSNHNRIGMDCSHFQQAVLDSSKLFWIFNAETSCGVPADERPHHDSGTHLGVDELNYLGKQIKGDLTMPILLFAGIPILLVGGGFVIYKLVGA